MKKVLYRSILIFHVVFLVSGVNAQSVSNQSVDPAEVFTNPPESAKPGVLWMWMGSNLSKEGITKDLEALKEAGFNRTTMFSLADVTTPWAGEIKNSPTPDIISWTEPWWKLVRYAAEESKRLGMDFGMFNGPSYESSGGTWITPELSMQEICWSKQEVKGNGHVDLTLERPKVNLRANQMYPVYNPETDKVEKPAIPARKTYYKDIAVLATLAEGIVSTENIIDLSDKMQPDGHLVWDAPKGNWIVYRLGHTTMGTLIQPAQWKATGFECDKMSQKAVDFHMDHVIGEIQKHLGDLIGTGFTHVHFDSYEAGTPGWTPKMGKEFSKRRGYDLTPYLLTFAGVEVGGKENTARFKNDFDATRKDLYRDIYFTTISKKLHKAHLSFLCEPYGGPWRQEDIMPKIDKVMTEYWTHGGVFSPFELESTVTALRKSGQNIVEAEAFTGRPDDSKWDETPLWLKPIGDAAFCAGVNRLILHRFVQQPWHDRYQPGATMGQWGTHFDRTQTWWKAAESLVKYWQRCQALLQWGKIVLPTSDDFKATKTSGEVEIKSIHRSQGSKDIYFVANTSHHKGAAICSFNVSGMQPELWDPVTGNMRELSQLSIINGKTTLSLPFEDAQSFFVVFRHKLQKSGMAEKLDFPLSKEVFTVNEPWLVQFDSIWGGPSKPVTFRVLEDWSKNSVNGIKYYSGTAIYNTVFDLNSTAISNKDSEVYLDLGKVNCVAKVTLNNTDLGWVWTAPWSVRLPDGLLKVGRNQLEIKVSNVWANRLIGDEQEPADCEWLPGHFGGSFLKTFPDWFIKNEPRPSKGRFCFTTWNYFTKESPLISSGLLGPVRIMVVK